MRLTLLFWLSLLGGCTLLPVSPIPAERPGRPDVSAFALNGRVAIKYNGSRHSAGLRWVHQPQSDELLLLAPLGQTAARVYRDARHATLEEGDRLYQADDVESLMQQVLGWHLPLSGLHYWVLALPIAKSEAQIERDAAGRVAVLRQNGWEVRYIRYAGDGANSLPTRLELKRDGLQMQLLIDEWEAR